MIIPSPPALIDELSSAADEPNGCLGESKLSSPITPAPTAALSDTSQGIISHAAAEPATEHQPAWLAGLPDLLDRGPLIYRTEAPPSTAPSPDPYSWSQLLRRVFSIDVLCCHRCGGRRELISLITDPPVIRRILRHLDLATDPPSVAPARPRPQMAFDFGA